jgi:hypothetical protein
MMHASMGETNFSDGGFWRRSIRLASVLVLGTLFALGAPIVNGSFQSELADPLAGDTITGWVASGNLAWTCIAQSTGPFPCGGAGSTDTKFPTTLSQGDRAYRVGANGDFPRDPSNPDNETNSIYEATWSDIVTLNYNYLSQTVATTPGNGFLLTFQLQAMYRSQPYYGFWVVVDHTPVANLSARTQSNPVLRTDTTNQWATFQIPFTATGPTTEIGFASFVECNRVGCDIDLYVDSVSLSDLGDETQIPEPSTAVLFGGSLMFALGVARFVLKTSA